VTSAFYLEFGRDSLRGTFLNKPVRSQRPDRFKKGANLEGLLANAAMSILDGVVPYGVLPGNHDQPTEYYNDYFGYERYQDEPWYGGHYGDNNDNNYQLFSALGMDFIVLHLQFNPPDEVLTWADEVLRSHSDRRAILNSHWILNDTGERCEYGDRIYNALKGNENLFLMLCGHVGWAEENEAHRVDIVNDNPIYQLLADYQNRSRYGFGWLVE